MWGKPDALDRVAQVLIVLAALVALGNGVFMLADPFGWYDFVGTVRATGPANGHFIRDIGLAYLVSGGLLAYAAWHLPMRWGSALAGASWLLIHGLLHVWEVSTGICSPDIFWSDAPGVLGPPLLALTGIGILLARQRIAPFPLPGRAVVAAVAKLAPDEAGFLHELRRMPGGAMEKFQHFMPAAMHRHSAPADIFAMARIGATRAEDCGPCLLTAARGALADGVPRDLVEAALAGKPPSGPLAQAYDFGFAIASNGPEAGDLGDAIAREHGQVVRQELAMTAAFVRCYPALKRGLGFARSCALTPLKL